MDIISDVSTNCKFCSVVSKINGEDPIGSAGTHDHWLIIELPQPWSAELLEEPTIKPLIKLVQSLILHQVKLRPILIAPDSEYSQPGYTRVLYYRRPSLSFANFEKQEFLVLESDTIRLAITLLQHIGNQPNELEVFQADRVDSQSIRELLICTHGNVDVACSRFGYPLYKVLRHKYADHVKDMRVWRCSHFGGHQFAPTLIDLPTGQYWGRLEPHLLDELIHRTGDISQLRSCYRGWAGLTKFEQIAEREIWMQEGWKWLDYNKSGCTIAIDQGRWKWLRQLLQFIPSKRLKFILDHRPHAADWAVVHINFTAPNSNVQGTYKARIETKGIIKTMLTSGKDQPLSEVKQYQVSRLELMI
jgi:hypothetical protein